VSYVEHCKKHGQHHGEICGECFEELKELEKAYEEQEEELDATMMAYNILKKENEQLKIAFNSIKFALTEIAIHTEGTLTVLNDIEDKA
jgi:hypothetical protein